MQIIILTKKDYYCLLGIPVAEFQMDGSFSDETFLNHTLGIGSNNLTEYTVCLRFNLNFLRGFYTTFLHYSSWFDDNTIVIDLTWYHGVHGPLRLNTGKYYFKVGKENQKYDFPGLNIHQEWIHVCYTNKQDWDTYKVKTEIYVNGELVNDGK